MTKNAMDSATRLPEVGFPEFTAALINSTFDALISANIRQMEAYSQLVKTLAFSLSDYINNTRDTITGEEILDFLERILPDAKNKVAVTKSLTAADAALLKKELTLPAEIDTSKVQQPVIGAGIIDDTIFKNILAAVANRIAASKYSLLQEMVRQGILRLVVENGVIETRMTFSAWDYSSESSRASSYQRDTSSSSNVGLSGIISSLISGPSLKRVNSTGISIKTATDSQLASGGTSINIFGGVRINFKTDYLPLAD